MSKPLRPPVSPEAAAVMRAMSGGRLSRRSMLAGVGAAGLGAALSACGTKAPGTSGSGAAMKPSGRPMAAVDRSDSEKLVNWANWTEYLDYNDSTKSYPTLDEFTKTTGIKASYSEDIDDNETYYAKVQSQLKLGKDIGKDIIVPTDWMAGRYIRQGLFQKLDKANIPLASNLRADLVNVEFDPGRQYTLTWQSGYTGIGYNVKEIKKLGITIKNVKDLWQPELKNRVMVLSEMRDTTGLMMLQDGVDITKFTKNDFENALAELKKQISSGQIRQVVGNSYVDSMKSGDALAVMCWSGDVAQVNLDLKTKNPSLTDDVFAFQIPEAGGILWSDNLGIPIGSPHKKNAEILMNYYYDPKVAATVAAWVNYVCPVEGAKAELEKTNKDLADSDLIFPSAEFLKNVHMIRSFTAAEETSFGGAFQKLLGL